MSKTIHINDIEAGLKKLNPDVSVDHAHNDDGRKHYGNRAGIYYKQKHITNIDRNDVPEYPVRHKQETKVPVTVSYGKLNRSCFPHIWYVPIMTPLGKEITEVANGEVQGIFDLGMGQEIEAVLFQDPKEEHPSWMLTSYFETRMLDGHIINLGWREPFRQLVAHGIPGITQATLEKEFDIELGHLRRIA